MAARKLVKPKRQKFPYFAEATSAEVVNARMGKSIDPRMRKVMAAAVNHLHAFVKEVEPSQDEWLAAIKFLTDTGHMCTDWRQEFILLSDVLGVSMLVDSINNRRPSGATENTVLGPFYIPDAPRYEHGANICLDGKGEPTVTRGVVRDTKGKPVAGALIDVWQANDEGFYDVQQKGKQPDMNLRGLFTSAEDGSFWFKTVKPRYYPIPDDGPVGKLLKSLGRHPNRPAHLHFIVTAPGYQPVVTHIFAPDCPYLAEDVVFGVKESLIGDYKLVDNPREAKRLGFPNPYWSVTWDVTLAKAKKGAKGPSVFHIGGS
jgi:catechol 1,2-dioxygenase